MDNFNLSMDFQEDKHQRTIIHIDIDCFYAQVEILKNPSLQGVPVGIQQKNIVVTCNYIAREFGVKKCMSVSDAIKLCPQIVLVRGEDLHDYRQMSSKITNLLQTFSPQVERLGLDENFVDVTHLVSKHNFINENKSFEGHIYKNMTENCSCGCYNRLCVGSIIASEMRTQIKKDLGLTSCAGISYNKLLSKLVCSYKKPNQQSILFPAGVLDLIANLPSLRSIPGIGTRLTEILQSLDITTISDLQNSNYNLLKSEVGSDNALRLKKLSFGIDNLPVKQSGKPQSIGLEDGFRRVSLESEVKDKFSLLLQKLMVLLSEDGRVPSAVKVTVRKYDSDKKTSHRESKQCNISSSCFSPINIGQLSPKSHEKLMANVMQLFSKMIDISKPFHLTLLGVAFTKFQERHTGKSSIASFLRKDISVQSVTSFKNVTLVSDDMEWASTSHSPFHKSIFFNSERSGSESEAEPSPKKSKVTQMESWLARRKRVVCKDDDSDDASPSKLRVSELRLNSSDSVEGISHEPFHSQMELNDSSSSSIASETSNVVNHCQNRYSEPGFYCPANIDQSVFLELPFDVQNELIQSWKSETIEPSNIDDSKIPENAKVNRKTLLHYFISNK